MVNNTTHVLVQSQEIKYRGLWLLYVDDDLMLHISSSSGLSTPPSSYPGPSTRPSYSPGPSRSAQNIGRKGRCALISKFWGEKIKTTRRQDKILEGTRDEKASREPHT
ncbi:hypothetical protein Tco_1067886 [Tanacetum coccineum]|uniref:Uncharacterized protein n=1 Tax=Tanacetum coccineum TaxID=301880 RepID=A0ABQ5HE66_9ASTR